MKNFCLVCALLYLPRIFFAQSNVDSLTMLNEVTVRGFETNRGLLETPAAVSLLNKRSIQRFSNVSLVPAFNTVPGVRMEERSPGSYRLSIRGSLLRSPFGIRNIKVYLDDIPFTDAGGNTYLNLIDPNALGAAEILKGPASSLYGAGTGGAVLLNEPRLIFDSVNRPAENFQIQLQAGSYGLFSENLRKELHNKNNGLMLSQTHLQSDGYRVNSHLRKDMIHFADHWRLSKKDELKFHLLLADVAYYTPGGLTLEQYNADPRQARPATATLPGALQQKIAVYNKTIFTGLSNTAQLTSSLTNITSLVFSYTHFKNPFITNYEKRKEASRGLRTKMIWSSKLASMPLKLVAGAELQTTFAHIDNFGNKAGIADTVQTKDEVNAYQHFYFAQADVQLTKKIYFNAGLSYNGFIYNYFRSSANPPGAPGTKRFDPVLSPRFALLFKPAEYLSFRASASKGFSAPTMAEVRPSEGSFFESLQPESGWNYEAGFRASLLQRRLQLDITAYVFNLSNAIVRRTAANGGEYFVNAGGTSQKGVEAFAGYYFLSGRRQLIAALRIWQAVTINHYRFSDYKAGNNDYSGNALTGVPKRIIVSGVDIDLRNGIYLNTTFNYTARLPVNDANTVYAESYHLLQSRLGYRHAFKSKQMDIFIGADNLLNEQYSLGNDINAAGNRYYNAAPLRNYFAGLSFTF